MVAGVSASETAVDAHFQGEMIFQGLGAFLALTGFFFLIFGMITLGNPGGRLVTSGIYSFSRHPIYMALSMVALGWSAYHGSWPATFASFALIGVFAVKVRMEERFLSARFGGEYEAYRQQVGSLFSLRKKFTRR